MLISANLNVDERKVLARSTETKSDAANGVNERIGLLAVDLAANAPDININDVCRRIEMQIPDLLQQHSARHDMALISDQIFKDLEFSRQQLDASAATVCRPCHEVQFQVSDAQQCFLDDGCATAGERLDARQQLGEGERLDKVVVAAGAQTTNALIDLSERADDESRRENPGFA